MSTDGELVSAPLRAGDYHEDENCSRAGGTLLTMSADAARRNGRDPCPACAAGQSIGATARSLGHGDVVRAETTGGPRRGRVDWACEVDPPEDGVAFVAAVVSPTGSPCALEVMETGRARWRYLGKGSVNNVESLETAQ